MGPVSLLLSVSLLAGAPPSGKPTPKPAVSPAAATATGAAPAKTPPPPTPPPTPTPVPTPSLKESVEFVKEKLATYGAFDFEIASADANEAGRVTGTTVLKGFDEKACVMTFARKLDLQTSTVGDPEGDYRDTGDLELRIPLKEVSSTVKKSELVKYNVFEVKRGGGLSQLEISGKDAKKPILVSGQKTTIDGEEKRSGKVNDSVATTYLIFADDDIANRTKKAFEHAIELCQKKKEAF